MAAHGEDLGQQHADAADGVRTFQLQADGKGLGELIMDGLDLAALMIAAFEPDLGAAESDMGDAGDFPEGFHGRQAREMHLQCLVELAAGRVDLGDPAHDHPLLAHVAEALKDRELLLAADAQGLVELAAGHMDVGDRLR